MLLIRCCIYIFGTIIGFALGVLTTNLRRSNGVIRIDTSNPEKDSYRLEVYDLDKMSNLSWIKFKILKDDSQ